MMKTNNICIKSKDINVEKYRVSDPNIWRGSKIEIIPKLLGHKERETNIQNRLSINTRPFVTSSILSFGH